MPEDCSGALACSAGPPPPQLHVRGLPPRFLRRELLCRLRLDVPLCSAVGRGAGWPLSLHVLYQRLMRRCGRHISGLVVTAEPQRAPMVSSGGIHHSESDIVRGCSSSGRRSAPERSTAPLPRGRSLCWKNDLAALRTHVTPATTA